MMKQEQLHLKVLWDMLDYPNGNPNFLNTMINSGCMHITWKPACSRQSGKIHHPQKQVKCAVMSNLCCLF